MPSQLMPFNEEQIDRCALWLATRFCGPLTQYEIVKFHVMTDIYHTLDQGVPVIGGSLEKRQFGPMVRRAWHRLIFETQQFERGIEVGPLAVRVQPGRGNVYEFAAQEGVSLDEEEFSTSETEAMEQAMRVAEMDFAESQRFFHEPEASFIGKVWSETLDGGPIDWNSIVDAYDAENGTDHSHIKDLIALGA